MQSFETKLDTYPAKVKKGTEFESYFGTPEIQCLTFLTLKLVFTDNKQSKRHIYITRKIFSGTKSLTTNFL